MRRMRRRAGGGTFVEGEIAIGTKVQPGTKHSQGRSNEACCYASIDPGWRDLFRCCLDAREWPAAMTPEAEAYDSNNVVMHP